MKHKSGIVDHGSKYCENLLALFTIRGVLSSEIDGFQIFSYLEGFGNLDDIVMNVEYKNQSKKAYVFQLKHKSTRRLNKDMLLNPKGDFSLEKYQNSYEKILTNKNETTSILRDVKDEDINIIIFTNMLFVNNENEAIKLKQVESDNYNFFINTSKKTRSTIFKVENGGRRLFNPHFLNQMLLYTSQMTSDEIEDAINQTLLEEFKDIKKESVLTYIQYISDWVYDRLGKPYPLSYKEIEMKLLEMIVQPWTIFPDIPNEHAENLNLFNFWNRAVMTSDLTILRGCKSLDYVRTATLELLLSTNVWDMYRNKRIFESSSTNNRIIKRIIIKRKRLKGDLNIFHIYMTLWEIKQLPLIIHCSSQDSLDITIKALRLFSRTIRKFVIVSDDSVCLENLEKLKYIYRTFINLKSLTNNLASSILSKIRVTLQFKKAVCLKELLSDLNDARFLTSDMILKTVIEPIQMGTQYHHVDNRIQRNLKKLLFTRRVIFDHNCGSFILYAKSSFRDTVNDKFCMDFDDYVNSNRNFINNDVYLLYLKEQRKELAFEALQKLHQLKPNEPIHLLEYLEALDLYRWVDSVGTVKNIKQYLVENPDKDEYEIKETEAFHYFDSPIQIICGQAGTGKTETLKFICNNTAPNVWAFYLDLANCHDEIDAVSFNESDTSLFVNILHLNCEDFSFKLFEVLLKTGKVAFFIDSLEIIETNGKAKEFVEFLTKICTKNDSKLWMASRSDIRDRLEDDFRKIPIELAGLNKAQALEFLSQYDGHTYEVEVYEKTVARVITSLGPELSKDIYQWAIISQILKTKDLRSFSKSDEFTFEIFRKSISSTFIHHSLNYESNIIMVYKMALSVTFQENILRGIIDFDEFVRLKRAFILENKSVKHFIITSFNDVEEPKFIDKRYVDFIVAHWLAQNVKRDTVKQLILKLFYPELAGVKQHFDFTLAKDHALHKAVINDDFHTVLKIFENHAGMEHELLTDVDSCGRTALHLSASRGKSFDFRTADDVVGINNPARHCEAFKFDIYTDITIPEPTDCSNGSGDDIFSFLVQKAIIAKTLLIRDNIGLTFLDNAYKSGCLINLNETLKHDVYYCKLSEDQNVFFLTQCYQNQLSDILRTASFECFCSVRVGRIPIVDDLNRLRIKLGYVQRCCEAKMVTTIRKFENEEVEVESPDMEDTKKINLKFLEVNNEWDGDFHRAARDCNYTKLQEMISNRLDDEIINTLTPASFTALHTLVCDTRSVHDDNFFNCAKLLIDNGIDVNHPDIHNQSVILHAAVRKYKPVVSFLIRNCWDFIDIDNYKQYGGESARKVILKHNLFPGKLPEERQIFDRKKLLLSSIKSNNEAEFVSLINRNDVMVYINTGDGKNDDISTYTVLQLCLAKNLQSFARTLIEKGADCFKTIQKNKEKPIEFAIRKHNYELVKLMFEKLDKFEIRRKINPDLLNHQDESGKTLLHEATYRCHFDFILRLLENGSSLFLEDSQGKIPLDTIHKSILSEHLDNCIDYDSDNDPEFISIEYETLIDRTLQKKRTGMSYSNVESLVEEMSEENIDEVKILSVIRRTSNLEDLLSHPVIRTLIDLKLDRMIWIYHINLAFYTIFWLFLHLNTLQQSISVLFVLFVLTFLLTAREMFQFFVSLYKISYFLQVENVIEVALLIFTYTALFVEIENKNENPTIRYNWLYISLILISTIDLLFLVGKNYFVHSIMTYRYILAKFIKYIAPFSVLFVTFMLCFQILLQNHKSQSTDNFFFDLFVRLFTAILMFSGELKEEYLYENPNIIVGRITVILFVFIMSTVLANMLLTLLVNDMDEMRHSALIKQYSEKTKYILQVESFINRVRRNPDFCLSKLFFCLLNTYNLKKCFWFGLFRDCSQIEIDLRSEKRLTEGTVTKFRQKVSTLIAMNRTREQQKLREIKRVIDKIVSSPDFSYRDG